MKTQTRHRRTDLLASAVLAALAGGMYLWGIGSTGWANAFYSAAAQAGSTNWIAFFYGSSDPGNLITVDKPPASLWLMALSVRLLGLSPFAILLPEAILGIGTVLTVYAIIRLLDRPAVAFFAATTAALTPAAALIFRYNNPDALLTFLLALTTYATVRAVRTDRVSWFAIVGITFGAGFLTKQLQAFLILPAVILVMFWAGQGSFLRRLRHVAVTAMFLAASAGWWVLVVMVTPPTDRPWIGGSADNNFLTLTWGYNGLGRMLGGSGNGTSANGPGIDRLFVGASGQLVGWILPAALVLAASAAVLSRKSWRHPDARFAALVLFAGCTLSTVAGLSFMRGIYHAYYTVALVPPLACTLALSVSMLWGDRHRLCSRLILSTVLFGSALWAAILLAGDQLALTPWAAIIILLGMTTAVAIMFPLRPAPFPQLLAVGAVSILIGPLLMSLTIAGSAHAGANAGAVAPTSSEASLTYHIDTDMRTALQTDAANYRWAAATSFGSTTAAKYQLSSGTPIMPIGGYKRSDPVPTLEQFQSLVTNGDIHWYLGNDQSRIGAWVRTHFRPRTIGTDVLYDLTAPLNASPVASPPAPTRTGILR